MEEETKNADADNDAEDNDDEVDIEKAIAREVQRIKRPRKETRFGTYYKLCLPNSVLKIAVANCGTDTPCGESRITETTAIETPILHSNFHFVQTSR